MWWPPQRVHVDAGYSDLPFPFATIAQPDFESLAMTANWTAEQMIGYVSTWSAVRASKANAEDPVIVCRPAAGGMGRAVHHSIRWPLVIRVGRA
jgi:hypothetical protein